MQDCYVTPTLINSWLNYLKSQEEWEEKAKTDFLNCLNKISSTPTEAMQRGINFEDMVRLCDEKDLYSRVDETVNEITDYIRGGLWQEVVTKCIEVDGLNVLVYGRADVIKVNTIYDIKRVSNYEVGKYSNSVQHKFYLFGTGLPMFKYLISEGKNKAKNVFIETYTPGSHLEEDVRAVIFEFFKWLKGAKLFETYLKLWKGKDK